MNLIINVSALICIYLYFTTDHLKVKWDKVAQFFVFMCLILMARNAIAPSNPSLPDIDPSGFVMVWWEDIWFSFPVLLAMNKWGKNKYTITLAVTLSILFALGHMYHGLTGMLITSIYPYFISYRYSKKTSLGTVMVCHVMYDLMLFYCVRLLT